MKTIKTDVTKNYFNASEALKDMGYTHIGKIIYSRHFQPVMADVYSKDDNIYYFSGMEHFNTTIYKVFLKAVNSLKGQYDIIPN